MKFIAHICRDLAELQGELAVMMADAPTFEDKFGYFEGMNIENVFAGFFESIDNLRLKLGEEQYARIRAWGYEAKSYFGADPQKSNGGYQRGMDSLLAIEQMVHEARQRKPKAAGNDV